ncbi:EF-hand domain-containing protein [Ottowia sp.]|uniref:EF-hand domain-containing protein n=1 Tax=Ottowia sp. TaxID=1898956 RepID=UPI0025EEAC5C|nr:EF-hand domain-containing protein [Ottowia sp.]MBK6745338.1 EF-hand domain-containing protein [Ottowia sp.]
MTAHRLLLSLLLALPLAPALAQSGAPAPAAKAPGKNEQQALKWFSMLDANGDGRVSREEAKVAFRLKPSLAEVFDATDRDRDGYLTQAEIRASADRRRAERTERRQKERDVAAAAPRKAAAPVSAR